MADAAVPLSDKLAAVNAEFKAISAPPDKEDWPLERFDALV